MGRPKQAVATAISSNKRAASSASQFPQKNYPRSSDDESPRKRPKKTPKSSAKKAKSKKSHDPPVTAGTPVFGAVTLPDKFFDEVTTNVNAISKYVDDHVAGQLSSSSLILPSVTDSTLLLQRRNWRRDSTLPRTNPPGHHRILYRRHGHLVLFTNPKGLRRHRPSLRRT